MNPPTAHHPTPRWRARSGQSLIEITLALPLLLLMLTGLLEFGFALNYYLNALDAAREGARYASDGDPTQRELAVIDCGTTHDFYMQAACVAEQTLQPISLNPATDDIVISVFRVLNGHVISRWPNCASDGAEECPNDPPAYAETGGEWHRWGQGSQCSNGLDDDHDGAIDDGCVSAGSSPFPPEEGTCVETDLTCHISHFTTAEIEARIDPSAPNTAVMLVEVFYSYDQLLKLPWITAFVPDPLRMHSYTIIPVPAAEPSLAISGTVLHADGTAFSGVTINFSTGSLAITDVNGDYDRKGFDSGSVTVTPSYPGCTFSPPSYNVVLVNQDVNDVDFQETVCIPTATPTLTPSQTETPNPIMTSTPTSTNTSTPTSTNTQTPTRTPTPTNTTTCNIGVFDASKSTVAIITPPSGIVQADNTSTAQIVVTARDNCFNLMANLPVTLSSSRGATDSISPSSANTNASGQAIFTVKSAVMSPWNISGNDFTPSVFNATLNSTLLTDHADIKFVCVRGEGVPAGGNNEVFWQFTNSSTIARRLIRLDITWPQETGRLLQEVRFGGTTIWNLGANFSPVTINSNWVGSPTSRDIGIGVAKSLLVTFNFLVTGSQEYTVKAFWDDTADNSTCDSGSVTVIRTGAGTAVPTSAVSSTPQNTVTPTVTRTNTPVPINPTATNTGVLPTNTSTSTPTNTSAVPTNTPTRTNTPPALTNTPTQTPTSTSLPPTATRTNTPTNTAVVPPTNTPTRTNTPVPPTATNTPVPPTATRTPTSTPDTQGPSITNFAASPNPLSSPNCTVTVSATITDPAGVDTSPAPSVSYSISSPASSGTVTLVNTTGNTWAFSANISALMNNGATITWSVTARDNLGNVTGPVASGILITNTNC